MVLAIVGLIGLITLLFAGFRIKQILDLESGNAKMNEIATAIKVGANAYLKRQFTTLLPLVIVLAAVIGVLTGVGNALAFVAGVVLSGFAGALGMMVSVRANVRTAKAAEKGIASALSVAFNGGSVTGLALIGLGLIGVSAVYYLFGLNALIGFGFGASLISLFARVGGGIYTKAADVGADLVGKVEKGIPEDDPRNPAVIADNVGDNVGDCAGMAADLFESYVVTIIAAMLIGASLDAAYVQLPLLICAMGAIATVIGTFTMSLSGKKIMAALYKPVYATALLTILGIFIVSWDFMLSIAASIGVVLTLLMFWITEYYTSTEHKPVKEIANAS
ncbi:sodium/proton-translocating pyrophosphatase, partial [Candidatus Micrarchaeota archaeon]|nr:sodium/proton-translocating pyrophosphatase [Candidatus Micrarchaeota archaeon]